MYRSLFTSDLGALLIAAPFFALLFAGFLHLDRFLSMPRRRRYNSAAPALGFDPDGRAFFTDPDGRPWYPKTHPGTLQPPPGNFPGSTVRLPTAHDCSIQGFPTSMTIANAKNKELTVRSRPHQPAHRRRSQIRHFPPAIPRKNY